MAIDCLFRFSKKEDSQLFNGHVVNISGNGILFTARNQFEEGDHLDFVLTPTNSLTLPMEASVVVVRVTFNESVYELACKIIEIKQNSGLLG